jgi:hypothetical protein
MAVKLLALRPGSALLSTNMVFPFSVSDTHFCQMLCQLQGLVRCWKGSHIPQYCFDIGYRHYLQMLSNSLLVQSLDFVQNELFIALLHKRFKPLDRLQHGRDKEAVDEVYFWKVWKVRFGFCWFVMGIRGGRRPAGPQAHLSRQRPASSLPAEVTHRLVFR